MLPPTDELFTAIAKADKEVPEGCKCEVPDDWCGPIWFDTSNCLWCMVANKEYYDRTR